jgi:SAM-dependent methyltransferase
MADPLPHNPWDKIFQTDGAFLGDAHPLVVRFAERVGAGGGRMLDVGCGTGRHLQIFAERGYDVVGLDSSTSALEGASASVPGAKLILGNLFDALPFAAGEFSVVVACQSIHHAMARQVDGALAEIARVMAPGAWFYVSVPTLRNQGQRFAQVEPSTFVPLDGPEEGLPHHFFDEEELRARLRAVGLHAASVERDATQHLCAEAQRR